MVLLAKKASHLIDKSKPFLKWAGGKSQLIPEIMARVPITYKRYFEPFIGGGAVFFFLEPQKAIISDVNRYLIITYKEIRDNPKKVIIELKKHSNTKEYFYHLRSQDPEDMNPEKIAARMIYLNRTCFNGLHRVNKQGKFNVPYGYYQNPTICDEKNIYLVSRSLKNVKILSSDVFELLEAPRKGDFVYLDPPYDPVSSTSSFTAYTEKVFGKNEQERLSQYFIKLVNRGVHILLSNSDTPFIRKLYQNFRIEKVYARRAINSKSKKRGKISEVLISP